MNKNMRKMYTEEEIKDVINYAIEKGLINNTKPIFIHPITMTYGNNRVSCLIFNDDGTPFTKTSLTAYIKNLAIVISGVSRIPSTGGVEINGTYYPSNHMYSNNGERIYLSLAGVAGAYDIESNMLENSATSFYDAVNKIN